MALSPYLRKIRASVGHELLILPSVSIVVRDSAGRVLLIRHADTGAWVTPGGSIEPNENPSDAAVREMWEETGLLVAPRRILGVYGGPDFEVTYPNRDTVSYVMTAFECDVIGGQLRPDQDEVLEMAYFGAADLGRVQLAHWATVFVPPLFGPADSAFFAPPRWQPK